MTPPARPLPPETTARLAGALYLVVIVAGVWGEGFARGALVVAGDAAATAANVREAPGLLRASMATDAVMAVADVALAVLLYLLLRPAGPAVALAAMVFRLLQAAVLGANLLHLPSALWLLDTGGPAGALAPGQAEVLALRHLEMHAHGYDLGLVFFGVSSLLTGWLLWRSGLFPRALGVALAAAGVVYLAGSGLRILAPAGSAAFAPAYALPLLAESAFCLWLLSGRLGPRQPTPR